MPFHSLDSSIVLKIIIICILLMISAFFSGSEASLFSLNLIQKERLRNKSRKASRLVHMLTNHPKQLIITILVGNDMINIASSVIATSLFVYQFKDNASWLTIAVMTPMTLVFAEILPKTIAVTYNEKISALVTAPLMAFSKLILPVRYTFDMFAELLIRLLGVYGSEKETVIMEDDFRDMVDLSHKDGELYGLERDLIHNVFEFSDTPVSQVMTPFKKIVSIPSGLDYREVINRVVNSRHSRIPVYSGNKKNIIGFLHVKDLLKVKWNKKDNKDPISEILRKPVYVLDSRMVDDVFYALKEKRNHIAVCHNANGDISGLVTLEDLLEELFGEIYDENDGEVS